MEPRRFQLDGPSLPELKARIRAEYGMDARIIAAEQVTVGGIRGFFARRHYEVTVEVPARRKGAAHAQPDLQARLGIAALLADADDAEARLHENAGDAALSTHSGGFAALMDELTFATARTAGAGSLAAAASVASGTSGPLGPLRPLRGAGDLVLLLGLGGDALVIARAMAAPKDAGAVRVGGALTAGPLERVDDRRGALAARAEGVQRGGSTFVAFGLGHGRPDASGLGAHLVSVAADQVWVVVDAGRKPADTARWVNEAASAVRIDALASLGTDATSSPGTIQELGLPVGWADAGWAEGS